MIRIESEQMQVDIDELGAQISSIKLKSEDLEFLWQKDSQCWSSSAPVPFPIIGKLNENKTLFDGKEYSMRSNGIIRYEQIPLVSREKNQVEFLFTNTSKTQNNYPFECRVKLNFRVEHNKLSVTATIFNDDEKNLYYNYAGHPGFRIPLFEWENANDYYIEFGSNEHAFIYSMASTGQLLPNKEQFFENERRFFIRKELFKNEAIAFIKPKSTSVFLKNIRNCHEVKVGFDGFDNLALWTPYNKDKELSLICIEPWIGHSDFKDYYGEFKNRDGVSFVEPSQYKVYTYTIEIK